MPRKAIQVCFEEQIGRLLDALDAGMFRELDQPQTELAKRGLLDLHRRVRSGRLGHPDDDSCGKA